MKRPVRSVTIYPELAKRGFRDGCRLRLKKSGDLCVLGCGNSDGFWVLNLTKVSKGFFTLRELYEHFEPESEAVA